MTDVFEQWFRALEDRHLRGAGLSFQEVRRSVQALSALYVERRQQVGLGRAFDGAGKRAAFAYFYAPLHFLLVREIVRALGAGHIAGKAILDLGCGTGGAAAAWALEAERPPKIVGIDRSPWAVQEARWTLATFGLDGTVKAAEISGMRIPSDTAVLAAFTMNELSPDVRDQFLKQFIKASERGASILIVEPVARRLVSWWDGWAEQCRAAGGREDEWRFDVALPERLALMDKAAGLDHRQLTGRSLWFPGGRFHGILP